MNIYFYEERKLPYGCFSNFSRHSFEIDGMPWQTVEHYFQAQKFPGTEHETAVQIAKTPMAAKLIGNDRARPIRPDWDAVKDHVMRRAVLAKFETHADIRKILLDTGVAELIEDAPHDYYWGCGRTRTGRNMLGKILMETRTLLRNRG